MAVPGVAAGLTWYGLAAVAGVDPSARLLRSCSVSLDWPWWCGLGSCSVSADWPWWWLLCVGGGRSIGRCGFAVWLRPSYCLRWPYSTTHNAPGSLPPIGGRCSVRCARPRWWLLRSCSVSVLAVVVRWLLGCRCVLAVWLRPSYCLRWPYSPTPNAPGSLPLRAGLVGWLSLLGVTIGAAGCSVPAPCQ